MNVLATSFLIKVMIPSIIPWPVEVNLAEQTFSFGPEVTVSASKELANEVAQLKRFASEKQATVKASKTGRLQLSINTALAKEGYVLTSDEKGIRIEGGSRAGVFYGIQTLRQIWTDGIVPRGVIKDQPRFSWRGAHLDVARHFMPVDFVKKYIDLLAMHKLNVFHWHLTEDQGWRIEIKRYPKLTQIGSVRKETPLGHNRDKKWDGKPHGGYYTQTHIREIVKYAADRHITVVPEIEMPGHAQAAIASYPELGNTGRQLEVGTKWGVIPHVFNAEDSTIKFLQNVLEEVLTLFPSQFIHIGGDECPKDEWKVSDKAQAKIKALGLKDEHELQSWFIRQMDDFLVKKGRRLIGWDEILEGGLAANATVMSWRGEAGGIAAAKAGHDVVMASTNALYFDYYQSKDTQKEPLAIGGFLPLDKVYNYEIVPKELTEAESKHILGGQFQLWTEYIPTPEKAEYMAFPRACAAAEIFWSKKEDRNYELFLRRLGPHLQRLKAQNVNYRPLDPISS